MCWFKEPSDLNTVELEDYVPIGFRTVFDRAAVVSGDLGSGSSVSLTFFFSDIKRHSQSFLVLSLVSLSDS